MAAEDPQPPMDGQPAAPTTNTPNETPPEGAPKPTSEQINLIFADNHGAEVAFKLKCNTKLGKAMNAYSAKTQKDITTLRFLFDGDRVTVEDTADTMSMIDGDRIEVHMEQIGGVEEPMEPASKITSGTNTASESDIINTTLVDETEEFQFKIKRTIQLESITRAYADRSQKNLGLLRFMFDGEQLCSQNTAEASSLKDGDTIEVGMYPATNGSTTSTEGDEQWLLVTEEDDDLCEDSEDDMPVVNPTLALRYKPSDAPKKVIMVLAIQHCTAAQPIHWNQVNNYSRLSKAFRLHANNIGIPFEELEFSLDGKLVHRNTLASTLAFRDDRAMFLSSRRPQ